MKNKKLLVRVKRKHIKKGVKFATYGCPVALAIIDSSDEFNSVFARGESISWFSHRLARYVRVFTPQSVKRFILRFDYGKPVKPFNFIIKPPLR